MLGKISNPLFFLVVVLSIGVAPAASPGSWSAVSFERSQLAIETAEGRHRFEVELAVTPAQRARGLMFRRSMAPDSGMLFLYDEDAPVTMWMENTILPLDMLFIEADGTIARIVERTVPLSRELISSNGPVRAVLELNAGTARRLGIRQGDRVLHEALAPGEQPGG